MSLEELSLSSGIGAAGIDGGGDEGGSKAPRLPRWTRQEILVLIQGKRVADNRVRRDRTAGLAYQSAQPEPKWAFVSSYCRRHGVNRGPVQCRKRWSNLAGDFKKIQDWESNIKDDSESFWVMRSDLRRDRKLPGFFDKEVYEILKGTAIAPPPLPGLALALTDPTIPLEEDVQEGDFEKLGKKQFHKAKDGLFPDFERLGQKEFHKEMPEEEEEVPENNVPTGIPAPTPIFGTNQKQPGSNPEFGSTSYQEKKRKRRATEVDIETITLQDHLIEVLERNGSILSAHLEAQNTNLKLDREERKGHANSLILVLNKLADALGRIADKL